MVNLNDLPVVIDEPGKYRTRDGWCAHITFFRDQHITFRAGGSVYREFRGVYRPRGYFTWHVSGRAQALKETAVDIVGRW